MSFDADDPRETERERALRALDREEPPPPEIERAVIDTLRAEGRIAGAPPSRRGVLGSPWGALAAAVALVAFGFFAGTRYAGSGPAPSPSPTPTPNFLLLLHEAPDGDERPEELDAEVREIGAWARAHAIRGTVLDGAPLTETGVRIGDGGGETDPTLRGFFRVRVDDRAAAERLARSCPHLEHGGWIVVREILGG